MDHKGICFSVSLLIAVCMAAPSAIPQRPPQPTGTVHRRSVPPLGTSSDDTDAMTVKQRRMWMRSNLDKSKKDAVELADLARELCAELDKSNSGALSTEVIERADKIEKLAKKIRDQTKIY